MRIKIIFLFVFNCLVINAQETLKTYYGDYMSPVDSFRMLTIFINIVFDQTPDRDTLKDVSTPNWMPGPKNTINYNPPVYLADYMDADFSPNINGRFTKRWAEASFGKFVVISDFTVVNIAQSRITPNNPGAYFNFGTLINSSISLINYLGGLQTIYGHNNINDYDGTMISSSYSFKQKGPSYNGKIDFIQFFFRNSSKYFGSFDGGGTTGQTYYDSLLIGGTKHKNDGSSTFGRLGNTILSLQENQTGDVHELAHDLIGMTNSAHMGGGGPLNSGDLITLEANSGGWSLLGSAPSSMVTCNAFERWRLDWRGPDNSAYSIAAGNLDSDIEKALGTKTFYLRDFISTGDAIRIKLPYKDEGALNQYIWLENHQLIHNTGKIDYPAYWMYECKDDGLPGIYSYYQVGKDIRESVNWSDMLPGYTDHLVPICADGNWDAELTTQQTSICLTGNPFYIQEYVQENPFSGYNDLTEHFFNSTPVDKLNWWRHRMDNIIKLKDDQLTNKLCNMGDNEDPFTGTSFISISTNPAPVNVVTYHHKRPSYDDTSSTCTNYCKGQINASSRINNRKIHLSGLRIDMANQGNGIYKVDIRWNDYDVTQNVRWTGDIVLREQVNLITGKKITLDQNYTPNKHIRDAVTGLFAGPTYFRCLNGSYFTMQPNSQVELNNLSSFILEQGSTLEIKDGAVFTVKSGCTMQIKNGAYIIITGTGKIEVENGGHFCLEAGGHITLQDYLSVINLRNGSVLGVNTIVLTDPGSCVDDVINDIWEYVGPHHNVNTFNADRYIQNKTFTHDEYVTGNNIYVGYDVTTPPYGNVTIQNGVKVVFDAAGLFNIKNNTIINLGGNIEIINNN